MKLAYLLLIDAMTHVNDKTNELDLFLVGNSEVANHLILDNINIWILLSLIMRA